MEPKRNIIRGKSRLKTSRNAWYGTAIVAFVVSILFMGVGFLFLKETGPKLGWLPVPATVYECKIETGKGYYSSGDCKIILDFEYEVDGKSYRGSETKKMMVGPYKREERLKQAREHYKGSTVIVYYNPKDPGQAAPKSETNGETYDPGNCYMLGIGAFIGGIFCLYQGYRKRKELFEC